MQTTKKPAFGAFGSTSHL